MISTASGRAISALAHIIALKLLAVGGFFASHPTLDATDSHAGMAAGRAISALATAFARRWACAGDRSRWAQSRFALLHTLARALAQVLCSLLRVLRIKLVRLACRRFGPLRGPRSQHPHGGQNRRHYRAEIARRKRSPHLAYARCTCFLCSDGCGASNFSARA